MKTIIRFLFILFVVVNIGCEPQVDDKIGLGEAPIASFDVVSGSTPNEFTLINTTDGAFITQWEVEANGKFEGETVEVSIPLKGEYTVTMTTFNSGGHATATSSVIVTEDDPDNCFGNMELLTGCGEKVWRVASEPSALHVGPNLEETWWGNSESDIGERACLFNDEYIFRANGEFVYDNKGDFWADTDGGGAVWPSDLGLDPGCHGSDEWPDKYSSWSSGNHTFAINDDNITVVGEGAHLALYKIGTTAEVTSPQSSVSLRIAEMSADRMVLFADYSGVVWRLTFVSE